MNQFKFDIDGNVIKSCEYCSVYRKGYMLVVEFISNGLFPILLNKSGDNWELMMLGTRVLVARRELTITVKQLNSAGTVGFVLESEFESIICSISIGLDVCAGAYRFQEPQLLSWAKSHSIERPVGCMCTGRGAWIEYGCRFWQRNGYLIVELPNGFKFPIVCEWKYVRVIQETIECEKYGFFVRVHEYDEYQVRFRVVVFWKNNIRIFEDIVYTVKGVRCGANYMSGGSIAKLMLLGG